jgi:hypothetical protein
MCLLCYFESKARGDEGRIVQVSHEAILQFGELHIVQETAPSFVELMKSLLECVDA